ncbi:PilW family protein [Halomonas tibetensis]|uniref:PilW family protein n=1 Tax=Halomonas tibetensis TaxID=2259590 RepID=A0ABV7B8R3_9GAMM
MTRTKMAIEKVVHGANRAKSAQQVGFSLIELLVALVIGLIIVLAAGSLLIANLQTFRQVEWLRDKQAAVTVAVDVLARDIRRARTLQAIDDGAGITLEVSNRGDSAACGTGEILEKTYQVATSSSDIDEFVLRVQISSVESNCIDNPPPEPIVGGFAGAGTAGIEFSDTLGDSSIWQITLRLRESPLGSAGETPEALTFNVVNRSKALAKAGI